MSTKIRSKILPDMNGSAATALKINIKPLQKLRKCVLFQGFIPPIVNSSASIHSKRAGVLTTEGSRPPLLCVTAGKIRRGNCLTTCNLD